MFTNIVVGQEAGDRGRDRITTRWRSLRMQEEVLVLNWFIQNSSIKTKKKERLQMQVYLSICCKTGSILADDDFVSVRHGDEIQCMCL